MNYSVLITVDFGHSLGYTERMELSAPGLSSIEEIKKALEIPSISDAIKAEMASKIGMSVSDIPGLIFVVTRDEMYWLLSFPNAWLTRRGNVYKLKFKRFKPLSQGPYRVGYEYQHSYIARPELFKPDICFIAFESFLHFWNFTKNPHADVIGIIDRLLSPLCPRTTPPVCKGEFDDRHSGLTTVFLGQKQ